MGLNDLKQPQATLEDNKFQEISHSPGPWTARPTGIPGSVEIRDSQKRWVATTYAVDYKDHPLTPQEAEVNARLISAAADYYAAVEYWLTEVYDGEPLRDWQIQLENAHRKAKGEL